MVRLWQSPPCVLPHFASLSAVPSQLPWHNFSIQCQPLLSFFFSIVFYPPSLSPHSPSKLHFLAPRDPLLQFPSPINYTKDTATVILGSCIVSLHPCLHHHSLSHTYPPSRTPFTPPNLLFRRTNPFQPIMHRTVYNQPSSQGNKEPSSSSAAHMPWIRRSAF